MTLGKTGQKVPALGMGTSWVVQPSFVQASLAAGIRYIDTSENYEGGRCEETLGQVLERTKMRKDVYLVTKNGRNKRDPGAYEQRLNASLERLRTDYVDCYYLHGLTGAEIPLLRDPAVKASFEKLKKVGQDPLLRAELPRRHAPRDRDGGGRVRLDRPDHDRVQLPDDGR